MGAIPEQSFTVRKPAWWDDNAEYVIQEYPGRDEAMRLAGHAWDVVELPSFTGVPVGHELAELAVTSGGFKTLPNGALRRDDGFKSHVRSDNLFLLHKSRDSFERIPNAVAYEIAELVFEQGFVYETGGTLDGGRQNYLTLLLNEPIIIAGDEATKALPFGCLSWAHDGSASLKLRSGTIVQVCENTISASEAEGKRLGTDYTFRHTKNWRERVNDARDAIKGIREQVSVYVDVMEELAAIQVTPMQRDLFVSEIIGDKDGRISNAGPSVSQRVKNNVERERSKVLGLFMGPTIPDAHVLTGYGLMMAGTEYFDHLRAYRSKDSYVRRTLLNDNPAKACLAGTIRELAAA